MLKAFLISSGVLLAASTNLAQQPVQPFPKAGRSPLGYFSSRAAA
jgi:hypothetical protein